MRKSKNFAKNYEKHLEEQGGNKSAYKEEDKTKLVNEEMGISVIVSALMNSKKPIIGHNFIYDLGFLYHQFISNLPETYDAFKSEINKCFPSIYDTKILAHVYNKDFTQFNLEKVLKKAIELSKNQIKFVFPPEFRNLEKVTEGHDAGFDAFCTGKAFTIMTKLIESGIIRPSELYKSKKNMVEGNKMKNEDIKETKHIGIEINKSDKANVKQEDVKKEKEESMDDIKARLNLMLESFKHGPVSSESNKK